MEAVSGWRLAVSKSTGPAAPRIDSLLDQISTSPRRHLASDQPLTANR
jgi:hypothetical protein